jgi:ubiquinone/menaquinone biosynthesis C-methylase UbiE
MPVLSPSEYDASYFDGKFQPLRHNAGYAKYERWKRQSGVNSSGEFWKDKAIKIFEEYSLSGKKVLDIGCAKGFIVKDLRDLGADAYGLEISDYAVKGCEPEVAPYLYLGDARKVLKKFKDEEFDVVFSMRFLECIDIPDIQKLIDEMARITKSNQIHEIDEQPNPNFYIANPLTWWSTNFKWKKGTKLISRESGQVIVV